jgi:His/Glu/Gln/Arg/opine family amino acid ABC transporter permease subunit
VTSSSFGSDLVALLRALVAFNLSLTVTAIAIALPIACLFAVGRLSRSPLVYYPVTLYVNLLRSSPLLMIMFWAYYTGPMLTGRPTSAYTAGLVALAAFEIAYFTELIRAGLQSIPVSQHHAALATGLRPAQATRFVVLPQALRRMLPSLLSQSIIAFQDSTIASVIGVTDVFAMTNIISAREQRPIELYTALAVLFFALCYGLSRAVRALEARTMRRVAGAAA